MLQKRKFKLKTENDLTAINLTADLTDSLPNIKLGLKSANNEISFSTVKKYLRTNSKPTKSLFSKGEVDDKKKKKADYLKDLNAKVLKKYKVLRNFKDIESKHYKMYNARENRLLSKVLEIKKERKKTTFEQYQKTYLKHVHKHLSNINYRSLRISFESIQRKSEGKKQGVAGNGKYYFSLQRIEKSMPSYVVDRFKNFLKNNG